ncbi:MULTISPECIES: arsenate reductase ArsC [Halomonadaceae]|jgi:protein-tyrosine-phosphatase|uniref:arsenate reductase ArsC n=1 Tax=Halomonadaceae TaxID=28256 RepID=UPI00158269BC|nr:MULTISPECIES: arsenate reductase ArsC [Halomonas]MDI4636873.1 arsenate reductase ArsC [Halomonas sp. BMC7]NUJ58041.1 arsenate reductase ArsC [Halomonas taeanensis]|tara:strand:- start:435 stop:845 length:411 start_codon:yes stop_codon:yes gene_type:complete
MTKPRVLFLCNANSARSIMAEALLRHMAGDRFDAFSAGVEPDQPQEAALAALNAQGIDTSGLASQSLEAYAGQHFDSAIILCEKAQQRCRDWNGEADEILFWDIFDPRLNPRANAYPQTLQEIRRRLELWLHVQAR